jgi:hypothetical protein
MVHSGGIERLAAYVDQNVATIVDSMSGKFTAAYAIKILTRKQ